MKTKITLFALFLIGLVISVRVNAQDLVVTNNTSCAIDITFSSVDQINCNISTVGPITVNATTTVTIPGPLSNGVIYKALANVGANTCTVWDCSTNGALCTPPGTICGGALRTCTISTNLCGSSAPTLTLTSALAGSNATLVIN